MANESSILGSLGGDNAGSCRVLWAISGLHRTARRGRCVGLRRT